MIWLPAFDVMVTVREREGWRRVGYLEGGKLRGIEVITTQHLRNRLTHWKVMSGPVYEFQVRACGKAMVYALRGLPIDQVEAAYNLLRLGHRVVG